MGLSLPRGRILWKVPQALRAGSPERTLMIPPQTQIPKPSYQTVSEASVYLQRRRQTFVSGRAALSESTGLDFKCAPFGSVCTFCETILRQMAPWGWSHAHWTQLPGDQFNTWSESKMSEGMKWVALRGNANKSCTRESSGWKVFTE